MGVGEIAIRGVGVWGSWVATGEGEGIAASAWARADASRDRRMEAVVRRANVVRSVVQLCLAPAVGGYCLAWTGWAGWPVTWARGLGAWGDCRLSPRWLLAERSSGAGEQRPQGSCAGDKRDAGRAQPEESAHIPWGPPPHGTTARAGPFLFASVSPTCPQVETCWRRWRRSNSHRMLLHAA